MIHSNCYNCSSESNKFYARENGYTLVKCDICGLLFVENRPDDHQITEAHKQGKHSGDKKFNITGRFNKSKVDHFTSILNDLYHGDYGEISTWLDVGCGHGEFILSVKKYTNDKISVIGSEPNVIKQESARKRGLNVSFIDIEKHQEKYDVVSLLNVYSHLPNPISFLESLKGLLKPKGELLIETGDTSDLPPKDHPAPFYLPDHLSFASEKILREILDRLGFEIVTVKKYSMLRFSLMNFFKELVKAILPGYKTRIQCYFKFQNFPDTDMFIRARLR